jgi:RNA polymerase sigma-70 factor (ECF subfamily)
MLSVVSASAHLHSGRMNLDATQTTGETFEQVVLPHLGAARRLARWLMRNGPDAEDVVQEASLRALMYFGTFTGGNGRAWFLRIVRNSCHTRRSRRAPLGVDLFDEEYHSVRQALPDPEARLIGIDGAERIERAIAALPARPREILVLRELKGMSYQEVAGALNVPMGTVMSGLWRARRTLRATIDPAHSRSTKGPATNRARIRSRMPRLPRPSLRTPQD